MEDELLNDYTEKDIADAYRRKHASIGKRGQVINQSDDFRLDTGTFGLEELGRYDEGLKKDQVQSQVRAANQGALQTDMNAFGQLLTGTAAEAAKTIGYVGALFDNEGAYGELNGFAKFFVEDIGESVEEWGKEAMPIYTNNDSLFDPLDHEWFANTVANLGPTMGMMVASMGTGIFLRGAGALSKAALRKVVTQNVKRGMVKAGLNSTGAKTAVGFTEAMLASSISRNAESLGAARQVYDDTLEKQAELHPEYDEDKLKEIATQTADKVYRESFALIAMDIIQYNAIMKAFKKPFTVSPKVAKNLLYRGVNAAVEPITEGLEEGVQFAIEQNAKDQLYGLDQEDSVMRAFAQNLGNHQMQESIIQGAIGGGLFKAIGKLKDLASRKPKTSNDSGIEITKNSVDETADDPQGESESRSNEPDPIDESFSDHLGALGSPETKTEDTFEPIEETFSEPVGEPEVREDAGMPVGEPELDYTPEPMDLDGFVEPIDEEAYDAGDAFADEDVRETLLETMPEGPEKDLVETMTNDPVTNTAKVLTHQVGQEKTEWGEVAKSLKPVHGAESPLIEAQIHLNAISASHKLTKQQKADMSKPYKAILAKAEATGKYGKSTIGYTDAYAIAKNLVQKHAAQINDNTQAVVDSRNVPEIQKQSEQTLSEFSKKDLNQKGKDRLLEEVDRRLAIKETPELNRIKSRLLEGPIKEETQEALQLADGKALSGILEQVVRYIGKALNVETGKTLKYFYDSNTLYLPEGTSKGKIIQEIIMRVAEAEPNSKSIVAANAILKEHNLPTFYESLSKLFTDPEFAQQLMAIPVETNKRKSILTKIFDTIAELFGITKPNLMEELIYTLEELIPKEKKKVKLTPTQQSIRDGRVTNIPVPYAMYTYNPKTGKVSHKQEVYTVNADNSIDVGDTNLSEVKKFASSRKRAAADGTEYKEISPDLIDLKASDLDKEDGMVIDKVIVLEQRGLNNKGVPVGQVRITFRDTRDGSLANDTFEVKFNKEKKLYVQAGYKSPFTPNKGVLLTAEDQPVYNDLYDAKTIENLKKDIPYEAELEIRVPNIAQQEKKFLAKGKVFSSSNMFVELFHNGEKVGILPGLYNKRGKTNQALSNLRTEILQNHIKGKAQGTVTFGGSKNTIIRTNNKYRWMDVLPTGVEPKLGLYTKTNQTLTDNYNRKHPRTPIVLGTPILQFSETSFHVIKDPLNFGGRFGDPVMIVPNERGTPVPIVGDRLYFNESPKHEQEFISTFMTSKDREKDLRKLVRYTAPNSKGNMVLYPSMLRDDNILRRYGNTKLKLSDMKDGTIFIRDINSNYRDFLKTEIKDGVESNPFDSNMVSTGVVTKDGWQALDANMNVMPGVHPLEDLIGNAVYHHPAQRYYQNHVESKPVQLDRDKMNSTDYITENADRMSFQVSPKTIFTIPERKVIMKMNYPKQSPIETQQEPIIPANAPIVNTAVSEPIGETQPISAEDAALFGFAQEPKATKPKGTPTKGKSLRGMKNKDLRAMVGKEVIDREGKVYKVFGISETEYERGPSEEFYIPEPDAEFNVVEAEPDLAFTVVNNDPSLTPEQRDETVEFNQFPGGYYVVEYIDTPAGKASAANFLDDIEGKPKAQLKKESSASKAKSRLTRRLPKNPVAAKKATDDGDIIKNPCD